MKRDINFIIFNFKFIAISFLIIMAFFFMWSFTTTAKYPLVFINLAIAMKIYGENYNSK